MTIKPDYSQIQTEAARRILIEVMNILEEYKEDMRVVGGWVPDLYYPERYHVRSIDVDMLAGKYGGKHFCEKADAMITFRSIASA